MQSLSSLADCSVNDKLVEVVPFLNQSFFRMILTSRIRQLNQSDAAGDQLYQFFVGNSVIIFLAPHALSTLRTLVNFFLF